MGEKPFRRLALYHGWARARTKKRRKRPSRIALLPTRRRSRASTSQAHALVWVPMATSRAQQDHIELCRSHDQMRGVHFLFVCVSHESMQITIHTSSAVNKKPVLANHDACNFFAD